MVNIEDLAKYSKADSKAKLLFQSLQARNRYRRISDVRRILWDMRALDPKVKETEVLGVLKQLESMNLGRLIISRSTEPHRFEWFFNYKEIASAANEGASYMEKQITPLDGANVSPLKRASVIKAAEGMGYENSSSIHRAIAKREAHGVRFANNPKIVMSEDVSETAPVGSSIVTPPARPQVVTTTKATTGKQADYIPSEVAAPTPQQTNAVDSNSIVKHTLELHLNVDASKFDELRELLSLFGEVVVREEKRSLK